MVIGIHTDHPPCYKPAYFRIKTRTSPKKRK